MKNLLRLVILTGSIIFSSNLLAQPKLSIFLFPRNINAGGKVKLSVRVDDEKAGISTIWCWTRTEGYLQDGSSNAYSLNLNKETGLYEHTFTMGEFSKTGKFIISGIAAEDNMGNRINLAHEKDYDGAVSVLGTNPDEKAPNISDIKIEPDKK